MRTGALLGPSRRGHRNSLVRPSPSSSIFERTQRQADGSFVAWYTDGSTCAPDVSRSTKVRRWMLWNRPGDRPPSLPPPRTGHVRVRPAGGHRIRERGRRLPLPNDVLTARPVRAARCVSRVPRLGSCTVAPALATGLCPDLDGCGCRVRHACCSPSPPCPHARRVHSTRPRLQPGPSHRAAMRCRGRSGGHTRLLLGCGPLSARGPRIRARHVLPQLPNPVAAARGRGLAARGPPIELRLHAGRAHSGNCAACLWGAV